MLLAISKGSWLKRMRLFRSLLRWRIRAVRLASRLESVSSMESTSPSIACIVLSFGFP